MRFIRTRPLLAAGRMALYNKEKLICTQHQFFQKVLYLTILQSPPAKGKATVHKPRSFNVTHCFERISTPSLP